MKKEDKELLLKDLCARLPYGVRVQTDSTPRKMIAMDLWDINSLSKPYLRPMSSMTEEELIEFNNIPSTKNYQIVNGDLPWDVANYKQINWLLKNHFDFVGLIPKNLAIEVTKENNPYENNN